MLINTNYEIRPVQGHWEVYIDGEFYSSADTYDEALDELRTYEETKGEKK